MDELFSKRLTELINSSSHTLDDIAEAIGKKAATVSRYASGEIKGVKRSTIISLANFFGVSPAWLAGLSNEKYSDNKITRIPVLSKIDISNILTQENIIDYISIRTNNNWSDTDTYFAIETTEDNMLPLLGKGDLAVIRVQDDVENGQTALIFIKSKNMYSIRKIIKTSTAIELHSMNPYYPIEKVSSIDDIKIIGRVVKADVESAFE